MSEDQEYESKAFALPEGRLINSSLFEKDTFTDERGNSSKPSYKVELTFEPADLEDIEAKLIEAAEEEWGELSDADIDDLIWPLLDGDKLAEKREKKGKAGDVYEGKLVIRANTIYNGHGEDGPGGIQVYMPDTSKLDPVANRDEIFRGIYGIAGVTIGTYHDDRFDKNGLKFYLTAFQKTRDGERIGGNADHSTLFNPVGRKEGEGTSKRRKRAG